MEKGRSSNEERPFQGERKLKSYVNSTAKMRSYYVVVAETYSRIIEIIVPTAAPNQGSADYGRASIMSVVS